MNNVVLSNTPWEVYSIDGIDVNVKREDLCCPEPGPSFSKIRGVYAHLAAMNRDTLIGVMDTRHSKAGWGVSYVCRALGMPCIDFFPVLKGEKKLRENQIKARRLGAKLYPMKAGMSAVLYNRAKRLINDLGANVHMLPNGLKLSESIDATVSELIEFTPFEFLYGTWIISISSGTIGAAVYKALNILHAKVNVIFHMGYSRDMVKVANYTYDTGGVGIPLKIIDEGYEYKDFVDNSWIPFPCNEYYDAKAFTWLARNVRSFHQPIVFWNIGA